MDKTAIGINFCVTLITSGVFFLIIASVNETNYADIGDLLDRYVIIEGQISCDGAEKYFTGDFLADVGNFTTNVYKYQHNSTDEMGIMPMSPSMMDNIRYDCEDISHGIECIAKQYNINCKFYTYFFEKEGEKDARHIGIDCNTSDGIYRLN